MVQKMNFYIQTHKGPQELGDVKGSDFVYPCLSIMLGVMLLILPYCLCVHSLHLSNQLTDCRDLGTFKFEAHFNAVNINSTN